MTFKELGELILNDFNDAADNLPASRTSEDTDSFVDFDDVESINGKYFTYLLTQSRNQPTYDVDEMLEPLPIELQKDKSMTAWLDNNLSKIYLQCEMGMDHHGVTELYAFSVIVDFGKNHLDKINILK